MAEKYSIKWLSSVGMLKNKPVEVSQKIISMEANDKIFLLLLSQNGDEGLHKHDVEKMESQFPGSLLRMEMAQYIDWQRDQRGRKMFLCLTWRGKEALEQVKALADKEKK